MLSWAARLQSHAMASSPPPPTALQTVEKSICLVPLFSSYECAIQYPINRITILSSYDCEL